MKDFRTELIPSISHSPIGLMDKIFTIGSCFADEIGNQLKESKFTISNNPFGTIYNPVSIHRLLLLGLKKSFPGQESYSQNEDIYFNYHFHSSFSSLNRGDLESKIQNSILESNSFLKTADRIIITYGTAFVYRLKSSNEIVANCHKMPSTGFEKLLLTEPDILKSFEELYTNLRSVNSSVKIILTVSPVRHLKDTLELNSISKSILRVTCHSIVNKFPDVEYFPAYEILLDDLRDYRFYKTDRLHPTEEGVEYIWEKFITAYFDAPERKFINEWQKIKKDLAHKPFQPQSESHQKFLKETLKKLDQLKQTFDLNPTPSPAKKI
ncbi:MAG: GSCFA domain-containing protein [Bacteroidetes bacterium]|nr:GSCFA domain-containing protein [Bacteroidota bacterium]MBI3481366.1 GSCFA domain-containing protein [Bacteroidota bacterium]